MPSLSTPLYIRERCTRGIHYCGARHGCTGCLSKYPCRAPSVRTRINIGRMQAWGSWCGACDKTGPAARISLDCSHQAVCIPSATTCNYCRSHERPPSQCAGAATEGKTKAIVTRHGLCLHGFDVESNGFAFAYMVADRKSARAGRLGRGGCWLAFLHLGTVYRIRGYLF